MLQNIHYDIVEEISNISKSLYRINTYIKDSKQCESCKQLWQNIKQEQEKELSMLVDEFKKHASSL
jgi:hypothetical protein